MSGWRRIKKKEEGIRTVGYDGCAFTNCLILPGNYEEHQQCVCWLKKIRKRPKGS